MKSFNIFILSFCFLPQTVVAKECRFWFQNNQIQNKNENCLLKCAAIAVDRRTFHCPDLCANFCKVSKKEYFLFKLSKLYIGLTHAERALVATHSMKMFKSYLLAWKADHLCLTLFKRSGTNDVSDACRHFVWAALLYKEWGQKFSQKIIDAHEQDRWQTSAERVMDIANNRLGQKAAQQLLQENQFSSRNILKSFQKYWKTDQLTIIKDTL